jgi:hypothetical protein
MGLIHYILIFSSAFLFSGNSSNRNKIELPEFENETMHYIVKYGMFKIGEADIIFRDDSLSGGINIKAVARSAGLVRLFKRLNYVYESHLDLQTGLPYNFTLILEDNRNYVYNRLIFDRHTRKDSVIIHSYMSGPHVVSKDIHDILTGFNLFRQNHLSKPFTDENDVVIKAFFVDELWDLRIRYAGKERINTIFGKVNCLKFKPVTIVGDFFKHDDDMTVWFSDDVNHIPLRITLNLTIGTIDGYLVGYRNSGQGIKF